MDLNDAYNPPKKHAEKAIKDLGKQKYEKIPVLPIADKNVFGKLLGIFKKFWGFLKKDSWSSFIVSLLLAFVFIKLIFFPVLSLLTGTSLPLVIVESCSMYHSNGLESVLQNKIYSDYGIDFSNASDWSFKNGLAKGDIVFVVGADLENLEIGNVVIFNNGKTQYPVIHRVIEIENGRITTKGDHNNNILEIEKDIELSQLVGKAVFRIPVVGWIKLIFFEWQKPSYERGICV